MAEACPAAKEFASLANFNSLQTLHPWFALCIRQRHREESEGYLSSLGYEYFSPTRTQVVQWSDRKKVATLPLFPGYMFCRFDPQKSSPILRTPGVLGIINAGGRFLEVDATQIEAIWRSLESGAPIEVVPDLVRGQKVRIISGPMAGIEGVLATANHQVKVGLEITMMNRSVLVQVSPSQLIRI